MTNAFARVGDQSDPKHMRSDSLLLSTAIAGIVAGLLTPSAARAADECGPAPQGVVTCASDTGSYPTGIVYTTPAVDPAQDPMLDPTVPVHDLTVNFESGVDVRRADGAGVVLIGLNDGAATLNAGAGTGVTVTGAGSVGVLGTTDAGDLTINTQSIVAQGLDSGGINALTNSGDILINAGTVAVTGDRSIGIRANSYGGDVTINAGTVAVSGVGADALVAISNDGNVSINVDNASTNGDYSFAVAGISQAGGDVTIVSNGTITTTGDYFAQAVYANASPGGDVNITVNNVSTEGMASNAVLAFGDSIDVTVNGSISTNGVLSRGVIAYAHNGSVTVTNNGAIETTGGAGLGIQALATAGVTIDGSGTVATSGNGATGIAAYAANGAISISATSVVTAGDYAQGVVALAAGDVTLDLGQVTTGGSNATGIEATILQNGTGPLEADLSLAVDAVTATGDYSSGISALSAKDGEISIDAGTVNISGVGSIGIVAGSYTAGITIDADTVVASGDSGYSASRGVYATSYAGSIAITSSQLVSTQGDGGVGIFAQSGSGNVAIDMNDVSTTGDNAATMVAIGGNASITISGDVSTAGANSLGVYALGQTGNASVVNNGAILTTGVESNGIDATGDTGGVAIRGTGSVATRGDFSTAIVARSVDGPVAVTSRTVATSGLGATGIDVESGASVTITAGSVTTTGGQSIGIAAAGSGTVTINAASVRTSGAGSNGVNAASFGGDAIVNAGSIRVSGADSTAIRALGFGGGANLSVSGAVLSDSGVGVRLLARGVGGGGNVGLGDPALNGIARLTLGSAGSITGGTDAVTIESVNGAVVNNAGTITGGSGYALRVSGGAARVSNGGTISGRLLLTGGADLLTNGGTLTLTGNSDFGAGNDALVNSGTVHLATTGTAQTVFVAGLETLGSSGTIDLRNGVAGDRLAFANAAYTGSGNASLGLDIAFSASAATADQLAIGSVAGSTAISLAISGTPTLVGPVTVLDVTSGVGDGAFTIAPVSSDQGLVNFGIAYNAADTSYQLVSAPSAAVYRQSQLGEALASLWNRSADAVSSRLAAARDAGWAGVSDAAPSRVWFQMLGETVNRRDRRDFNFLGLAQNGIDLGYRQDAFGMQAGVDLVRAAAEGGFSAGITGGYLNSTTRFVASGGDRFEVDAINIGAYAALRSGSFFVNGLAKYDFYKVDRRSYLAVLDRKDDANSWGGKFEVGLRLGSASFFAEPAVSLAYSRTSLDDFTIGGDAFDYDRFTGLRGKAGLRIGGGTDVGGAPVTFYVGGAAIKEFDGRGGLRFSSGDQTINLRSDRLGTYGQGTLGMNITLATGISGFIEGHGEFGSDYRSGGGGRAGLMIGF